MFLSSNFNVILHLYKKNGRHLNRKVSAILFILILIIPFAGSYWWFRYAQKTIRQEVKQEIVGKIADDELVKLTFTASELEFVVHWIHDDEFEFQGVMYDVVRSESKNDTTILWCYQDNKETKLTMQITRIVVLLSGGDKNKQEQSQKLIDFSKNLYFFRNHFDFQSPDSPQNLVFGYFFNYKSQQNAPPEWPPQYSCA